MQIKSLNFFSDTILLTELTTEIIIKAMKILIPSISPLGKPSLIHPIIMETIAAASNI